MLGWIYQLVHHIQPISAQMPFINTYAGKSDKALHAPEPSLLTDENKYQNLLPTIFSSNAFDFVAPGQFDNIKILWYTVEIVRLY